MMDKLKLLKEYVKEHKKMVSYVDKLYETIDPNPESPLINKFYEMDDLARKFLKIILTDDADWVDWYVYENDSGAKGYEAGYDKNLKPIKTEEDLLELIESKND